MSSSPKFSDDSDDGQPSAQEPRQASSQKRKMDDTSQAEMLPEPGKPGASDQVKKLRQKVVKISSFPQYAFKVLMFMHPAVHTASLS